jgi:hypothetical protein
VIQPRLRRAPSTTGQPDNSANPSSPTFSSTAPRPTPGHRTIDNHGNRRSSASPGGRSRRSPLPARAEAMRTMSVRP